MHSRLAVHRSAAGIAYVAHKAASPIRFPPTVALTPVVCRPVQTESFFLGACSMIWPASCPKSASDTAVTLCCRVQVAKRLFGKTDEELDAAEAADK